MRLVGNGEPKVRDPPPGSRVLWIPFYNISYRIPVGRGFNDRAISLDAYFYEHVEEEHLGLLLRKPADKLRQGVHADPEDIVLKPKISEPRDAFMAIYRLYEGMLKRRRELWETIRRLPPSMSFTDRIKVLMRLKTPPPPRPEVAEYRQLGLAVGFFEYVFGRYGRPQVLGYRLFWRPYAFKEGSFHMLFEKKNAVDKVYSGLYREDERFREKVDEILYAGP